MESAVEVRQLRAFVALFDHGSVTAAAKSLAIAQSTMSETLAALERAMGAPLFLRRRGSHELALTDAGEALLPHARSVLELIRTAHGAVAGATTGARGRIAIATNESLGTYVIGPQLDLMRRRWPNTTFEVTVMLCAGVRDGMERGEFDLGMMLRPGDDTPPTSIAERTVVSRDLPLAIFAQPMHPLARRTAPGPVRRDIVADYPLYMSDAAGEFHALVRRYLEHDRLPGPHIHPVGSVESVKRCVLNDSRAIGLLPEYALADELRDGRVVALRVEPSPPRMLLEALASRTRSQHPAIRQLIDGVATSLLR